MTERRVSSRLPEVSAEPAAFTFLGESFLAFLGASDGASGMGGGGGELRLAAELLRSRPVEWLDDSDVVRERRPGPWADKNSSDQT